MSVRLWLSVIVALLMFYLTYRYRTEPGKGIGNAALVVGVATLANAFATEFDIITTRAALLFLRLPLTVALVWFLIEIIRWKRATPAQPLR
jgi:hypothetical protein